MVKDSKKPHAFQLACRGIPEVIFAAADEQELLQWFTKLENATKRSELVVFSQCCFYETSLCDFSYYLISGMLHVFTISSSPLGFGSLVCQHRQLTSS